VFRYLGAMLSMDVSDDAAVTASTATQ